MASETIASTVRLERWQIEFFHANGFLAMGKVTTDEELARMRRAYDEIFARRAGRDEGMHLDLGGPDQDVEDITLEQILNPGKYHEDLRDTLYAANVRAIAKQVFGEEADGGRGGHAIYKHSGGMATPWHQDEAYWNPDMEYCSFSAWMPLQDVTVEGGCMQFIPGSHRLPRILPHRHIGDDPRVHGLELEPGAYDCGDAVACPLPAGGVTLHLNNTLHYCGPNRTDVPRRALILGGGLPAQKRSEPRAFPWQDVTDTVSQKAREDGARRKADARVATAAR